MKRNPDPRVRFEPDAPRDHLATWLPESASAGHRLDPLHWMTRSSRGLSWNRTGLVTSRDMRR